MSILRICQLGEEVLRTPAEPVDVFDDELQALVESMWETMYHADGVGLAAPQVGISKRLIVVHARRSDDEEDDDAGDTRLALVNPEVLERSSDVEKEIEGCLSIPGLDEYVERPAWVRVAARTPTGEEIEVETDGLLSRVLQHEIDHLDGVLFLDRVSPLKRRLLMKKWRKSQEE